GGGKPEKQGNGKTLEDRIGQDHCCADHRGSAVSTIGLKRIIPHRGAFCAGSFPTCCSCRTPPQWATSHNNSRELAAPRRRYARCRKVRTEVFAMPSSRAVASTLIPKAARAQTCRSRGVSEGQRCAKRCSRCSGV